MISLPIIFSKYYKLFIFTISSFYPSPIKYNFPLEFRLQNKNKKRYIPNSCFTKNFNVKLRYACKTFDKTSVTPITKESSPLRRPILSTKFESFQNRSIPSSRNLLDLAVAGNTKRHEEVPKAFREACTVKKKEEKGRVSRLRGDVTP